MSLVAIAQVRCPACGAQYRQETHQAIDVSKEPELKNRLLRGQFNVAACQQCGTQGLLTTPFIYHDPEKSLFYLFMPMEMGANNVEQQRIVGRLSNQFMEQLPPEQRRGYMFQPKIYFSLQSMLDDILVADGISREELQDLRERAALVESMVGADTLEDLRKIVDKNRDKVDYQLLQLITGNIEQAQATGDQEAAQTLANLRDDLLSIIEIEGDEQDESAPELDRDAFLEMVIEEREPEALRRLISLGRPLLDYYFFQSIADRIERAEQSGNEIEAKRLTKLRANILEIMDEMDASARESLRKAADFIQEAMSQPGLEAYLREHAERLDDAFFAVLNMNISAAQQRQDENAARSLAVLGNTALRIMEEKAPPEVRLVNKLLQAEPEQRTQLLIENHELINEQFVALVQQMRKTLAQQNGDLATRLDEVLTLVRDYRREE